MKKILLATAAAIAMASVVPAVAADLAARPYTKAPMMMEPAYNWSGFYAGVNAGYTFGDRDRVDTTGQAIINQTNVATGARPGSIRAERDGFIGGGQIGYNWQVSPTWVLGIEADIQYVDADRTTNVLGTTGLNNSYRTGLEYLGTVRGRVGYAFGQTMIYGTGGLAYGRVENSANLFGAAGQSQFFGEDRSTKTGYTVGGGIEHMFSPNWSVKAEYLYYDLGRSNLNVAVIPLGPPLQGGGTGYNTNFRNEGHIARVGLNYKFGGPIVARY